MTTALHIGDCRAVLATLPDASVHCVVTSPPYWGLRDYGTATWEGGDPRCDHLKTGRTQNLDKLGERLGCGGGHSTSDNILEPFKDRCGKCGAIRIDAQLGLEPDFNAYVASMVAVFREVRRVLRDDGTLWLNLGDSYSTHAAGTCAAPMATSTLAGIKTQEIGRATKEAQQYRNSTLPQKNLIGIPWRVAFALQADGWYLRQDIIWSKPNPMPESVTDRCTKAHEYLFLLSKRERYYYDADAIAERLSDASIARLAQPTLVQQEGSWRVPGKTNGPMRATLPRNIVGNMSENGVTRTTEGLNLKTIDEKLRADGTRNKRSVWEVTTQPFSEAHFATFPPALIEPCIKAGCPVGGTVLDPFGGAGTTGLVADRLQRNAILIELNQAYAAMSSNRIKDDAPLFAEVAQP